MEQEITVLQSKLTKHFAHLIQNKKLVHAYLLSGATGLGKLELAIWIAQAVFCNNPTVNAFPCLKCNECIRIKNNEHPDVIQIIPDGQSIKVDTIRYLKDEFSKSGLEGNRKVFIIKDAEKMTISAANSLLKFIEEPSGDITAFLLTSHLNQMLPTIVSRCQVVELDNLNQEVQIEKLINNQIDPSMARLLVHLNGNIEKLTELGTNEHFQKLVTEVFNWIKLVLENDLRSFVFIQTRLMSLTEDQEMQQYLLELMLLVNRDLLLIKYNQPDEIAFQKYKKELVVFTERISSSSLTTGIECILDTWNQKALNVSFQNILESLTLKLCQIYHKG